MNYLYEIYFYIDYLYIHSLKKKTITYIHSQIEVNAKYQINFVITKIYNQTL